jgi:hypothetical protein
LEMTIEYFAQSIKVINNSYTVLETATKRTF